MNTIELKSPLRLFVDTQREFDRVVKAAVKGESLLDVTPLLIQGVERQYKHCFFPSRIFQSRVFPQGDQIILGLLLWADCEPLFLKPNSLVGAPRAAERAGTSPQPLVWSP